MNMQALNQRLSDLKTFMDQHFARASFVDCHIEDHYDTITTYQVGSEHMSISTHNGIVSRITYK